MTRYAFFPSIFVEGPAFNVDSKFVNWKCLNVFGPLETLIVFLRENQGVVFPVLNLVGFNLSMSFLSLLTSNYFDPDERERPDPDERERPPPTPTQ